MLLEKAGLFDDLDILRARFEHRRVVRVFLENVDIQSERGRMIAFRLGVLDMEPCKKKTERMSGGNSAKAAMPPATGGLYEAQKSAAMKVEAILRRRTATRDFYDLYSLCQAKGWSLLDCLDLHARYCPEIPQANKQDSSYMESRFFFAGPDPDDAAHRNMGAAEALSLRSVRHCFMKECDSAVEAGAALLEALVRLCRHSDEMVPGIEKLRFGIARNDAVQLLVQQGRHDDAVNLMYHGGFDVFRQNREGRNTLELCLPSAQMARRLLRHSAGISDAALQSPVYNTLFPEIGDALRVESAIVSLADAAIEDGGAVNPHCLAAAAEELRIDHVELKARVGEKMDRIRRIGEAERADAGDGDYVKNNIQRYVSQIVSGTDVDENTVIGIFEDAVCADGSERAAPGIEEGDCESLAE